MNTLANKIFNNNYELSEKDFYPPEDNRIFKSNIHNINYDYEDFTHDYNEICENEEIYESN